VSEAEITARLGLNVEGFYFKWKRAKAYEVESSRKGDTRLLPYWERVRLTFLELGGEYAGQKFGHQHRAAIQTL
jgi:hypothetical protein